MELKGLERVSVEGKPEYSLFHELISPERMKYWILVVLPHENAQPWVDARRAYHGGKTA
jgi:hypothetical protein